MRARLTCLLCSTLAISPLLWAKSVDLDYHVRFLPQSNQAEVRLTLEEGTAVHSLTFDLGDKDYFSDFKADGKWQRKGSTRGTWKPSSGKASLSYRVRINHPRKSNSFDARMTEDWALLRGDDLVPSAYLEEVADPPELVARLEFELPKGWTSVETGWPRIGENRFRVNNRERKVDRPTGWILAGKIGSRRAQLGETMVTVAAPVGEDMRRMDILTLLTFVWPEAQAVFPRDPDKLLIVGASNPMWRGGLSASNSFFMHSGRPLISENGTSTLMHELVHVFSGIHGTDKSDWISEGLAEYYAIELLRRAGGLSEVRYQKVREHLIDWSEDITSLRGNRVSGPTTARAVLLLQELDKEIRQRSQGQFSLDDVSRGLMRMEKVSTQDFIDVSQNLMSEPSEVLDTKLLR